MITTTALDWTIRNSGAFRCLECGKCTAVCPVSWYDHQFSPRRTVGHALMRKDQSLLADDRLWSCLTCMSCSQVCPAAVAYSDLTLSVRTEARKLGRAAVCTHGELIHAWMRLMLDPELKQDRLRWLTDAPTPDAETWHPDAELRVAEDSETLFFVGCAPYFDIQFRPLGVDANGVVRATLRALNLLGIEPQVMADERCCGHDLLWEGDTEAFAQLADLNATLIRDSGAKRIVSSCPECVRTLAVDYPAHGIDLDVEVLHLSEVAAEARQDGQQPGVQAPRSQPDGQGPDVRGGGAPPNASGRVTYHDPCRLGRHRGVFDAPRRAIRRSGAELVEMPRRRENSLCCGTNGWSHCGAANKSIQADRLREAQATGADRLVTACLKCQIHFMCALQDGQLGDEISLEITDLSTMIAESLSASDHPGTEGD